MEYCVPHRVTTKFDIASCSVNRCLRSQSGLDSIKSTIWQRFMNKGVLWSKRSGPRVARSCCSTVRYRYATSRQKQLFKCGTIGSKNINMSSNAQDASPNRARGYKRRRDSASPTYFDQLNGQAESSTARNGNGPNHESRSTSKGNGKDDGSSSAWDQVDDENYTPYVPLSKRRANLLSSLHQKTSVKNVKTKTTEEEVAEKEAIRKAEEEEEEVRREKARKERTLLQEAQEVKKRQAEQGLSTPSALSI